LWAAVSAAYSALLSSSYFERINDDDDDDDNMCEMQGGVQSTELHRNFQCKEWGPLLRLFTMEMNERGYKIKGPH